MPGTITVGNDIFKTEVLIAYIISDGWTVDPDFLFGNFQKKKYDGLHNHLQNGCFTWYFLFREFPKKEIF